MVLGMLNFSLILSNLTYLGWVLSYPTSFVENGLIFRNVVTLRNKFPSLGLNTSLNEETFQVKDAFFTSMKLCNSFDGARGFSAKSMRSKVERRMRKESGKTLREIRRAKKLRKKLMTDEERLLYNLRRVGFVIFNFSN